MQQASKDASNYSSFGWFERKKKESKTHGCYETRLFPFFFFFFFYACNFATSCLLSRAFKRFSF